MSKPAIFVSGTIVLIFLTQGALASPQSDSSLSTPPGAESMAPSAPPDENLSISEAPHVDGVPPVSPPRYYPYRQALTFRGGLASDFPKTTFDDNVLGFQYLFPKFLSPKIEAGADLHKEGNGHIHFGVRWIYSERSYFRPSGKISLDHMVESKENLATFAKPENYYARFSGTLEYVVYNPLSLRLEPELLLGFKDSILVVTLGLSHGW